MEASKNRYENMQYRRAGRSGVDLPVLSLGLWHNFGAAADSERARSIVVTAFDRGINCFDLANNYGPPPGSAEERFGAILKSDLAPFRDELIITTKAGFRMWPGPYGDGGSRKYLLASLDQSLKRMGLDYVDVFYSHRHDPDTPLEETMGALDQAVRSGKALYAGLSNYGARLTREALGILRSLGTPCLLHQPYYNMFGRGPEEELFAALYELGLGCAVYSPLAQGTLTDKYLDDIPADSRAANPTGFLTVEQAADRRGVVRRLNEIAIARGQTLAQMALAWVLRLPVVTSAIVGVSRVEQLDDDIAALNAPPLTEEELHRIEEIIGNEGKG
ncbi:MAG TPA: aldo/keto reductase [Rhodothermales bacterium]|nr:aldo/keto reductase [Rhodothermales bacterium]